MKEFKKFLNCLDMASAELQSFVDSKYSKSELDRVDEANELLFDSLYEDSEGGITGMSMPDRLEELLKYLAYLQQETKENECIDEAKEVSK